MKRLILVTLVCVTIFNSRGVAQSVTALQATAKNFMKQGDFANAILILNRCIEREPANTSVGKDLAMSYFYSQNNIKALETINPVLESNDADDQCFLIAGNIYKQLEKPKEGEKVFKKGIEKFPESGPLYNELGELQIANNNKDAIKSWEKGIKADPSFGRNYFNASRYYFFQNDFVWSILYGEIFVNIESSGNRAPEIKKILLDSYKQLFTETSMSNNNKSSNPFVKQYLEVMKKQEAVTANGINAESLSMIRARFIIDWFSTDNKPAFRLFDMQQQLLKSGMFEAYNQWLFGITENLTAYQNWIKINAEDNNAFLAFQKSRVFKMPADQYYHEKK